MVMLFTQGLRLGYVTQAGRMLPARLERQYKGTVRRLVGQNQNVKHRHMGYQRKA